MNAAPVTAAPFGLVSMIVITLVSPVPIDAGAKLFEIVSVFATMSVSLAAVVLEPALPVVSAPAAIVFV